MAPASAAPDRAALATAATLLANAERPLVIAQRGAGSQEAFTALARLVEDWAFPLSHYWANQIAHSHDEARATSTGSPDALVREADVILVINALAPWWPDRASPSPTAKIIQLGPDPLFARSSPMRTFRSDVTLAGDTAIALLELIAATNAQARNEEEVAERRARIAALAEDSRNAVRDAARAGNGSPMSKDWVSHCLGQAVKGHKASVFHELGCPLPPPRTGTSSFLFPGAAFRRTRLGPPRSHGCAALRILNDSSSPRSVMEATCSQIRSRAIRSARRSACQSSHWS